MKVFLNYLNDAVDFSFTIDISDLAKYDSFMDEFRARVEGVQLNEDAFPSWINITINKDTPGQRDTVKALFIKHYPFHGFGMALRHES